MAALASFFAVVAGVVPLHGAAVARPVSADAGIVVRPAHAGSLALRARPGGRVVARLRGRTEFDSPLVLSVVRQRGTWLGVATPALPNGRLGWIDRSRTPLRLSRIRLTIEVDLSRRRLALRSGRRILRELPVAVGAAGSPTPVGRFAVTDKKDGSYFGGYYGCCVLALSGHQPHPPAGWRDGTRLAIHGGSGLGSAVSAGCLHAGTSDLRYLMRRVPLGTPVVIHP